MSCCDSVLKFWVKEFRRKRPLAKKKRRYKYNTKILVWETTKGELHETAPECLPVVCFLGSVAEKVLLLYYLTGWSVAVTKYIHMTQLSDVVHLLPKLCLLYTKMSSTKL
jgi:hypothetical protein